ncbi:hypothetical protein CLOHAE12215_02265 [Clostridium haemolyticum]|uniref:hypothetical protein n=1 Tax=Clostridium haemolyticum TaxID=84025 RepID=UPI001C3B1C22|nr:hypothetical protein [Clostridium haemolyticum]CAG7840841.1 hypothetical protein CLOHAE12215_02265 [Clostridium haemolyticum]
MNKFAVAVLSFFENDNKVFIVEGSNPVEAMCLAIAQFQGDNMDEDTKDWINSMKNKAVDEVQEICADGDLAVSNPVLIK